MTTLSIFLTQLFHGKVAILMVSFFADFVKFHNIMNRQWQVRHLTPRKESTGNNDVLRDYLNGCNIEQVA